MHRQLGSGREAEISRQYSWASQTDTVSASFQGQLFATGDKAAKTAGARPASLGLRFRAQGSGLGDYVQVLGLMFRAWGLCLGLGTYV